ncbi:RNA binding motif protein 12Ba [Acanthochromis polyacanthus]|uniref:RNA binding motif protein 12Ba n=1 Tax=Acanthochromis polyacanthus TaxID=80966 RepID=UPI00223456A6|nr:RNA binding motif protein 12Ba [Acanthochromis polyacanthus]XP_051813362.1 RNA binding motif protein 12Ba [Acanthochromis polyacanthus]XP_051813363.1 RNA binding motif protein 12Ba [Acanthochromis polyacanthus]
MYIILRLQGLDVKAGVEDIRAFFHPLHIPDGGVVIVGGSLREAFIAFISERHAQLAMRRTGNLLKGSEVTMHISSMVELEHKLELLLNKKKKEESSQLTVQRPAARPTSSNVVVDLTAEPTSSPAWPTDPDTANLPLLNTPQQQQQQAGQTLDSGTAFLLGICTVLQGLQSSQQVETIKAAESPKVAVSPKAVASDGSITPEQTANSKPGYVRLFGLPPSTTKEDICRFFSGLTVQEAIVNVQLGLNHGCLVKFANMQDARDALCFNQQLLGQICVEVRGGTEKMWNSALQECETASKVQERPKLEQNPLRENHKQKSLLEINKRSVSPLPSTPAKKPKIVTAYTPPPARHIVMVNNLPKEINKTEIKELFGCPNVSHKNVLHLLDKFGRKTDTAFLIFDQIEDYEYALNLSGCHVGTSAIQVSAITEQMMREKMSKARSLKTHLKMGKNPKWKPEENVDRTGLTCLFVRNLPAHVQKGHVGRLFYRFRLTQDSIVVLHDSKGNGLGEVLVQFDSEKTASFAYKMNGKKYLGAKLLFTRISEKQMDDILNKRV